MAVINRFLKNPHRDWKKREEYGKSLIQHKNSYKEQSIMNMHTKRINVLEEYRALELLSLGTAGKHKWQKKDQDSESSVEQIDVKSNQFGTTLYGKTASEFFSSAKEIKYMLKTDQEQVGDRPLFHSELKRTNMSKVNWINYILAPFLILCSGLCACAMYTFEDNFARAVFIMVIVGYILDWLVFRFIYILAFSLYKYLRHRKS